MMWPRASISAKRINEVLDKEISIIEGNFDGEVDEVGVVEFRNVSFKYPDADSYLLKNISFKVNKGETIAFIGSTGSGKSTLINLVPRFYDATDGEVLIDGVNVKEFKFSSLRNKVALVLQKSELFSGTIKENICWGKEEATMEEVKNAARIAQADSFIEGFNEGYDTFVTDKRPGEHIVYKLRGDIIIGEDFEIEFEEWR